MIPKNKEMFKAYETATGRKALRGPFKARRTTASRIEAVDRNGDLRTFGVHTWLFRKVNNE